MTDEERQQTLLQGMVKRKPIASRIATISSSREFVKANKLATRIAEKRNPKLPELTASINQLRPFVE